jgi:hypothetical protein
MHKGTETSTDRGGAWAGEKNPDIGLMLRAIDGDAAALRTLEGKSEGLALFTRAAAGDKQAFERLKGKADDPVELDYLYATVLSADLDGTPWARHPELPLLFGAIKGDGEALRQLRHKKALCKLAEFVREAYAHEDELPRPPEGEDLAGGAAADVGILVAEEHLAQRRFAKAVEAFTRAIETTPTPDAYEGRARAYHGLAEQDERKAVQLRARA